MSGRVASISYTSSVLSSPLGFTQPFFLGEETDIIAPFLFNSRRVIHSTAGSGMETFSQQQNMFRVLLKTCSPIN